jgi:hypothetical protein
MTAARITVIATMRMTPITGETASSFSLKFIIHTPLLTTSPRRGSQVDETTYFAMIYKDAVVILSGMIYITSPAPA